MGRLAIVLPELSPTAASQYAHFIPLIREIGRQVDVSVVVEKGTAEFADAAVIAQRQQFPPARAAELALILIRLRLRGYRHAFGAYSRNFGIVAGLVGRLIGIRTAFWHCREDFFNAAVSRRWRLRDVLLDTAPLILSLHLCRLVLTGTPSLAEGYVRRFRLAPDKVRVVPNTVDPDTTSHPSTTDGGHGRRVLFVGRLTDHKGADLLPQVWQNLAAAVPDARLTVVGTGPLLESLERDFAADSREGRVTLLGALPNPHARRLMNYADLLLVPSRSEGFPRVLLEAMAAGLPFAATAVGGVREVVPRAAIAQLTRPGEPAALASAARRVLSDPELHRALAQAGTERVREFTPEVVAPRMLEAIGVTKAIAAPDRPQEDDAVSRRPDPTKSASAGPASESK